MNKKGKKIPTIVEILECIIFFPEFISSTKEKACQKVRMKKFFLLFYASAYSTIYDVSRFFRHTFHFNLKRSLIIGRSGSRNNLLSESS